MEDAGNPGAFDVDVDVAHVWHSTTSVSSHQMPRSICNWVESTVRRVEEHARHLAAMPLLLLGVVVDELGDDLLANRLDVADERRCDHQELGHVRRSRQHVRQPTADF